MSPLGRFNDSLGLSMISNANAGDELQASPAGIQASALREAVDSLLSSEGRPDPLPDRRKYARYAYTRPLYLTPIDERGTPIGEPLIGLGKHLSENGIGFFHFEPLLHRLAIVSLERDRDEWLAFELQLRWCRFIRQGWYESGGRLLRPVSSPLDWF